MFSSFQQSKKNYKKETQTTNVSWNIFITNTLLVY